MPDTKKKRVPDHRSDVLKGSLPQGPLRYCAGTLAPVYGTPVTVLPSEIGGVIWIVAIK